MTAPEPTDHNDATDSDAATVATLTRTRDHAAHTSTVTRQIADQARRLALTDDTPDREIAARVVALGSLADTAHLAAQSIDRCLPSAGSETDHEPADVTLARIGLAHRWVTLLGNVLTAATVIHASLLARLADHVALAEEHHPSSPHSHQVTAATLTRTAHALRQKTDLRG